MSVASLVPEVNRALSRLGLGKQGDSPFPRKLLLMLAMLGRHLTLNQCNYSWV